MIRLQVNFRLEGCLGVSKWPLTVLTQKTIFSEYLSQYFPNNRIHGIILTAMDNRRGWRTRNHIEGHLGDAKNEKNSFVSGIEFSPKLKYEFPAQVPPNLLMIKSLVTSVSWGI